MIYFILCKAYNTLIVSKYGRERHISTKFSIQTSQLNSFFAYLINNHILGINCGTSYNRLQSWSPTHNTTTNGENITFEWSSLVQNSKSPAILELTSPSLDFANCKQVLEVPFQCFFLGLAMYLLTTLNACWFKKKNSMHMINQDEYKPWHT